MLRKGQKKLDSKERIRKKSSKVSYIENKVQISSKDVTMEEADATTIEYPAESFDVIYSRDTILHIKDKLSLYKKFLKWLKPGGRLMVSDYNCTPDTFNDEFKVSLSSKVFDYSKLL